MASDIVLTLDFFLRDWLDSSAPGEVWVCVQPHVVDTGGPQLEEWIRGSETGSSCTYRLASPTLSATLVPVNFNDDVNVSLDIFRGTTATRITNDRRGGVRVRDDAGAREIARVNREPRDDRSTKNEASENNDADIPTGPFASGYNATLRAALAAQSDPRNTDKIGSRELAQMLQTAFWGGTRRYIPVSAVDTGNVRLMQLPESDGSLVVTNLHSLCGLLFPIGTRADLEELQRITDIQVVLQNAAGTLPVANHDAKAQRAIQAFFSKLTAKMQLPSAPFAKWSAGAAKRVYAIDHFASLTPVPGPGAWYRRQSESPGNAQHRRLDKVRRLVVRFETHRLDEAPVALPAWPQIGWEVWDAFDVTLTPYRRFPTQRPETVNAPLHLKPSPLDRKRFYDELAADPQLFTSGRIRLVDENGDDQLSSLQFLGNYDYPWDRAAGELAPATCPAPDDRTVLLHGPKTSRETLTLLVKRNVTLDTVRTGDDDTFGPRWEFVNAGALPPVHFTHLRCVDPQVEALELHVLPAVSFQNDLRFEFAQAASSIEGTLEATFPHGAGTTLTDPDAIDPADEFVHDLVNHNAINVYALWDGKPLEVDAGPQPGRKAGHLNPYGQIYPAEKSGNVTYQIPFRHRLTPASPPPGGSPQSVRLFFRDMYTRIGATRTLAFDFEHTYGTQLQLPIDGQGPSVTGLSSHYDFDLLAAPDVTRTGEPGAGCPETKPRDFLTVAYVPSGSRELLRFTLHTKWLNGDYAVCGGGSMRPTHVAAWRAVAELAYAGEVRVSGLFRRFDFHAALKACDTDGVAAGLKPVPEFENREWVVPPAMLSHVCRELLDADTFPDAHTFEIVLTGTAERPKVFESCNVIEIFLTTSRDPARLAKKEGWSFVKPMPQVRGAGEGFRTPATGETAEADEVFPAYLRSLASKRAVVRPVFIDPKQAEEAERFRRLLGNGISGTAEGTARREADPGAWILPQGLATTAQGSIVPSVCPLTFRPPALDPLLGPLTFELVRKYFRLLQAVIDCDFHDVHTYTDVQWRAHFTLMQSAAQALGDSQSLFDAVLDSVIAVPDTDPASGNDAEVRELAAALRDPSTPAAAALRRWIGHRLWREPGVFADAKALLFHRLRPASGTTAPGELYSLESARVLSVEQQPEVNAATFRQALADLAPTPWFGVAEVLDDVRYDNEFTFSSYRLRSFEGVVTDPDAPPPPNATVPIHNAVLHVPAGEQHLDRPNEAPLVRLASRTPVIAPAHLFTGQFVDLQRGPVLARLRNQRLSLDALKRGTLAPAVTGEAAVRLAGGTADLPSAPRLDEYVLSALFSIQGDEETANDWRGAFENDELRVHLRTAQIEKNALETAGSPSAEVAELFAAIADVSHAHQAIIAPGRAVAQDALDFVAEILRRRPAMPPAEAAPSLVITRRAGTGDCVDVNLTAGPNDPLRSRVQAILFAAAPDGIAPCDKSVPRTTFVLMVNVLARVWDRSAVGIVQTRNARHGFASDLAQTTQIVLPEQFHQPFLAVQGPSLTLARRPHTMREIVNALAFAHPDLAAGHDMSVTVSHLQRRQFPAMTAPSQFTTVDQFSTFPLANPRKFDSTTENVVFDAEYDDFVLDLQWSSATNLQFFRVTGCKVELT